MNMTVFAIKQVITKGKLCVTFSDGSKKYYDALELTVQWFKMSNDSFYEKYGFNFNPHEHDALYEKGRKIVYG